MLILGLVVGCAELPTELPNYYAFEQGVGPLVDVKLQVVRDGILAVGPIVVNLACDNVFGTATGDWTASNVSANSGGTVSVISGKVCRVTLVSYNDGTNTYTAVSSNVVVPVSNTGTVTPVSAAQYTSGGGSPVLKWFAASSGGTYSIVFNYVASAVSATTTPTQTTYTAQTFTVTITNVPAPTVSNVTITQSLTSGVFHYKLTASITGSPGCKFIDNSSATYTPTLWNSVSSAYNNVGATTCPTLTTGGAASNNWDAYWQYGKKYLVMWANTVGGVNGYITANIGP